MVNQILGSFSTRSPLLLRYLEEARERLLQFEVATLEGIHRTENCRADVLARMATGSEIDSE